MSICVTGLGVISSVGSGEGETLQNFRLGERRAGPVSLFESAIDSPVFEVKNFSRHYFSERLRTLNLSLAAIEDAVESSPGLNREFLRGKKIGVAMGTTVGSILNDLDFYREYRKLGKASMEAVNSYLQGNLAQVVHQFYQSHGPSVTVVNACASGTDAIGTAMSWLKTGICDIAIAGGADEMNHVPLTGFNSLGILSSELCSPFDAERKGLNLGEGAGVFILETSEHVEARGGRVRGFLRGYGTANDGYHLTKPEPNGLGLEKSIRQALQEEAVDASDVCFVNAHGTATHDNDLVEGQVLKKVFGDDLKFVSTKGYTGHTLGAAGALEACFSLLALEQKWIPGNAGFSKRDENVGIEPVKERSEIKGRYALSTSLGFGGCDAAVLLQLPEDRGD